MNDISFTQSSKDKEKNLKQRLVLMSHVTVEGEPRSINHHEATPGNPKDYYVTKMPDGKKMKAVTYEGLIDKLYAHYTNGIKDYTVESIFNAALFEKQALYEVL